jgi:hypothetical protein
VVEPRLYQLIRQSIADRRFEIEFLDASVRRLFSRSADAT